EMSREGRIMKQKEYRTVWITRHMRAGMLAAGLLLPLVAGAAALFSGGNGLDIRFLLRFRWSGFWML
ncbi:hypothetical protein ACIU3O_004586, partial [Salmonella enterica subsp. enterica serovar Rough O:c:1,5]